MAIRFFVGILGGAFIPCQVWTTGFFDKNVVGTANSLTAGLGNAGGGITYFVMPAIFDSLVSRQHLSDHVAWRVAFVVPFVLIALTAIVMLTTCPDTPTGRWSARRRVLDQHLAARDTFLSTVGDRKGHNSGLDSSQSSDDTKAFNLARGRGNQPEPQVEDQDLLDAASWELVEKPTIQASSHAILSWSTLTLVCVYFCTFGTELCINNILGSYYLLNFPKLQQTGSGNWAAMFGLLNAVFRPMGGIASDLIYRQTHSLWGKKILIHVLSIGTGVFLLVIGLIKPHDKSTLFGLMAGLAFFEEAANGAIFSLVPHVHPSNNGKHAPSTSKSDC